MFGGSLSSTGSVVGGRVTLVGNNSGNNDYMQVYVVFCIGLNFFGSSVCIREGYVFPNVSGIGLCDTCLLLMPVINVWELISSIYVV